jgi:hypothetical protein
MRADLSSDILAEVLDETFEAVAFMSCDAFASVPEWTGPVVEAAMTFAGPEEGTFVLAASKELASELTANILGLEPDDAEVEEKLTDGFGEVLNMLVGVLVARAYGDDVDCRLGLPSVSNAPGAEHGAAHDGADVRVSVMVDDEYRVDLALHVGARAEARAS